MSPKSRVRLLGFCLLAAAASATLIAQEAARTQFDLVLDAWDTGHYPEALSKLRQLLTSQTGDTLVEPAALLTGELYKSIEVSPPDRLVISLAGATAPKFSPNGRYFAFESFSGTQRTIHLYQIDNGSPRPAATIEGFGSTFSFDGSRVAFLRVVEDDELRSARAARAQAGPRTRGEPTVADLEARKTVAVERTLSDGRERVILQQSGISKVSLHYATDDRLFVTGAPSGGPPTQVQIFVDGMPLAIAKAPSITCVTQALEGGRLLVAIGSGELRTLGLSASASVPICPVQALDDRQIRVSLVQAFGILDLATGSLRTFEASSYAASPKGDAVVFAGRVDGRTSIQIVPVTGNTPPTVVKASDIPTVNPVLSPDGRRVAFQMMPREDWELYVVEVDTKRERRITNEIQHDHTPRFLTSDRLFGLIGENRHRRSYAYDVATGTRTRLFHNNSLRTLSMEYGWAISPDGRHVLVVADRDGDTISPERGVYLMDVTSKVSKRDVLDRVERQLASENDLRERGLQMFGVMSAPVREAVRDASPRRIYEYERDLVGFGSKYITQPGNRLAAEYIHRTLTSFGYTPEYQFFDAIVSRTAPPVRTANVIATLRGTKHPELEYLVSSHFDSVEEGPGADDDTSGSAALLEVARILRNRPMAATVKFIWFTGEEAGLLGSEEYVRQAVARKDQVVGALNNDMVGFADDNRLDDTIRFANASLRDLQHASAFLFTNLVTYDTRYFRGTDADSYFEPWGDIFSGIGSYPILGNPHYHQSHDTLDTVSIPLITEVARTTAASIMLMASSPSRLGSITATSKGSAAEITWAPAREKDVSGYVVRSWTNGRARDTRTGGTRVTIPGLRSGDAVWVKAINARGLEGWDWQRTAVK